MFWFNKYWIDFKKDTTHERILKVLKYYEWKEVNAWKLCYDSRVLHYTNSIMKLRKKHKIENRTEYKWRVLNSFYKLIS